MSQEPSKDERAPSDSAAPDDAAERTVRSRWLLLTLIVLGFLMHSVLLWGEAVDDAYISFRYARNLVEGNGLGFNPGERVEGYTNFLWMLLSALVLALRGDPSLIMPLVGLACGAGLVLASAAWGRRLATSLGQAHPLSGLPAALVLAASPGLAYYATSGLETTGFALVLSGAGFMLVSGRPRAFAVLAGVACWIRPEAALLGLVGCAALWLRRGSGARARALSGTLLLSALVLPYAGFKLWYFGTLLPTTALAKPTEGASGLGYLADQGLPLAGLVICAALHWQTSGRQRAVGALLGLWAIFVVAVVGVGGDWMPGARMLVPTLPWLALAADGAVLAGSRGAPTPESRPLRLRLALPWMLLASYFVLCIPVSRSLMLTAEARAHYNPKRVEAARALVRRGMRSVGTFDIGLIGWVAPELRILDLGGLTDPNIAKSPGLHARKHPPDEYLLSRAPDAFLCTSRSAFRVDPAQGSVELTPYFPTEAYVMSRPWFSTQYAYAGSVVIRDDYQLHVFERRPDLR